MANTSKAGALSSWIGAAIIHGMFGVTALMGLSTFSGGVNLILSGQGHWAKALLIAAMGGLLATIGLGYFYFQFLKAPAWRARTAALAARYPNQPWMLRSDWAGREVRDSKLGMTIFMWVWVLGWWGLLLVIWSVNQHKIIAAANTSPWEAALFLLFPLCGLIGLTFAWQATRSWLRYGTSTLRLDTLPGHFGDRFRGSLIANFRTPPRQPMDAELVCERITWHRHRTQGRATYKRNVTPVWSQTHQLEPSRIMISGRGADRLTIDLPLPAHGEESGLDENGDGYVWRLNVRDRHDPKSGRVPFSASFEIPVYARR